MSRSKLYFVVPTDDLWWRSIFYLLSVYLQRSMWARLSKWSPHREFLAFLATKSRQSRAESRVLYRQSYQQPRPKQENWFKTWLSTFFSVLGKCKGQQNFSLLKQLELFKRFVPYDLKMFYLYAPGTRNYRRWKASIYFSPRTKMFSTWAKMEKCNWVKGKGHF